MEAREWYTYARTLETIVRDVGRHVMTMVRAGFATHQKTDREPVTTVDLEVNRILHQALMELIPEAGWLSEETPDRAERFHRPFVWVVDPLDGTREFLQGLPEFTISVALVEAHRPVLGVVYNPSTDELFLGVRGQGVWKNGTPIHVVEVSRDRPRILVSRREYAQGLVKELHAYGDLQPVGSIAYRLGKVAAGEAEATVCMAQRYEWDVAAGVLIVEQAGGQVTDRRGRPIRLNRRHLQVAGLIAATPVWFPDLLRMTHHRS